MFGVLNKTRDAKIEFGGAKDSFVPTSTGHVVEIKYWADTFTTVTRKLPKFILRL